MESKRYGAPAEKIVRKRAAGDSDKYNYLTKENYKEIITDLVGVRALHLFKVDFVQIDAQIRATWNLEETAKIYIRKGDQEPELENQDFSYQLHPKGYRSIHYIISTQPQKTKIFIEVQIRTIFEEGWSEIDHQIRYPNFSDNNLVEFFLQTFNRISGSADEMGSFVKALASELDITQDRIRAIERERDNALGKMEKTINSMQSISRKESQSKAMVDQLRAEVDRLRSQVLVEDIWQAKSDALFLSKSGIDKYISQMDEWGKISKSFSVKQLGYEDILREAQQKASNTKMIIDGIKESNSSVRNKTKNAGNSDKKDGPDEH